MIDMNDNEYTWPPGDVPGVDLAQLAAAAPAPRVVWLALRVSMEMEVLGVFSTGAAADAACKQPNDVYGPIEMDVMATGPWIGAYYPRAAVQSILPDLVAD